MGRRPLVRRRGAAGAAGLATIMVLLAACGSGHGSASPVSKPGSAPGVTPSGAPPGAYSAWPEAGRDAAHSATASVRGPQTGHVRWMTKLHGAIAQGPGIGQAGAVYVADNTGVLDAVDPRTGRIRWSYDGHGPIGDDLSTSVAVLPDGTIVWPGPDNKLYGLSPSGQLLWTFDVGGPPLSPVIAAPDQVDVMTRTGTLWAITISPHQAAARWSIRLGSTSYGSPVLRPDGVIETTVDDSLVAVRDQGSSAKQLWRVTVKSAVEVSPAVSSTNITILGTNDGHEYAVSRSGRILWRQPVMGFSYSSPSVTPAGTTYFGDNKGNVTVADVATGHVERVIHGSASGGVWTAPVVDSAGDVYFGTTGGHIYGFSATGKQLLDVATAGKTDDGYPAITSTGDLVVGSDDGYLYDVGG